VEPEDAVGVLRKVHRVCRPGGSVLDLTCVPPAAAVELDGRRLGRLDERRFLERAAQTEAAVDLLIDEGRLLEEASLAHDVLKHYSSGPELVAQVSEREHTRVPPTLTRALAGVDSPVVERTNCLLRRLRVVAAPSLR